MIFPSYRPVRASLAPRLGRLLAATAALLGAGLASVRPLSAQGVAEVQVTPETMTLGVGQRQTLFATAYDRQGNLIPNARFTFWSSDTLVVKVGKDGSVQGMAAGLAKIEARVQGRQASTAILITGPGQQAASSSRAVLTLEPGSAMLLPGESVQLEAKALREDGTPELTGRIRWKSLMPTIATADSSGVVVAVATGRTIIQATASSGIMATMQVEVAPAEINLSRAKLMLGPTESDTIEVQVPQQGNRVLRGGVQWYTSDSAVARVGPTGVVSGIGAGRAEIVAVAFGQERRAAVTVHREPNAIVVTPRPSAGGVQLPLRAARRITAVAEAADSTPIPEARILWTLGDTSIAGYDAAKGELSGRALGATTLTARLHGFDPVVWAVQVIPGALSLDRRRAGLELGERDSVRALLLDEGGRPLGPATDLAWTAEPAGVVQVSGGIVDGLRPGKAVVTAKAPWGKDATAEIFVVKDLLLASNRRGKFGLYQIRSGVPDTLQPVFADSADSIQPALSPDRTRIAFSSNRAGSYDLYLMDSDGTGVRRLSTDPGAEGDPVWTADGSRLVYTFTPKGGQPQIYVLRPDGNPSQALTAAPGGNHSPTVSADGKSLAFVSTRDGNQEIYLMPIGGGEPRRITKTDRRESLPRFLPNGDLLYVVERGGRSKGSRLMRLTETEGEGAMVLETEEPIGGLGVSRDGQRIAYVVGRLTDAAKGSAQFALLVQTLAAGGAPTNIPLQPREHVLSPSF